MDMEQVFNEFSGGDKEISFCDLRKVIQKLNHPLVTDVEETVQSIMQECDKNEDQKITWDEFKEAMDKQGNK